MSRVESALLASDRVRDESTASSEAVPEEGALGAQMHALAAELFPICRSITGDGVRETLAHLSRIIPLEITEVPSGTPVFDWTVPREWNIRAAHIRSSSGEVIVDLRDSTLHVVSYSVPVHTWLSLAELRERVHTLPEHSDWIPYRTSYYRESWGFCMTHRQLDSLPEDEYEVVIDSTLADGSLTYGECYLPGEREEEVLVSCHICHPSLANDNLSGMVVATYLARWLQQVERSYSYRFLFLPATIGSITWLARNEAAARRVRHGLVLACVGDPGAFHYKRSRRSTALIDRAVEHVLQTTEAGAEVEDFSPYGYDERQYCSPGFDLPVGCLMRTPHGRFAEYHTSADNLDFIRPESLQGTLEVLQRTVEVLEGNEVYLNLNPFCEPQLGRRGLMGSIGGHRDKPDFHMAMLWVLNLSDGTHDLLSIAERSGLPFDTTRAAAALLEQHGLLRRCGEAAGSRPV